MPWVKFKFTILASKWAKTVHALGCLATWSAFIYLLVVYFPKLLVAQALWCWFVGLLVISESESLWKATVMTQFGYCPGICLKGLSVTMKNFSIVSVQLRFEPGDSKIQVRHITWANMLIEFFIPYVDLNIVLYLMGCLSSLFAQNVSNGAVSKSCLC